MSTVTSGVVNNLRYRRVHVGRLVSCRYGAVDSADAGRHDSWDDRLGGIDTITTDVGETLRLCSSPMQSPPKPGWILMLTGGDAKDGFTWTLYGMSRMQHQVI